MTITFALFHGSALKGAGFTATSASEINAMIEELNSIKTDTDRLKWTATITKVEQ